MAGIICIMIGLIMNAVNIFIPIHIPFPEYERTNQMGEVVQNYVTQNILHSGVEIDVLPNVIGGLLLISGCIMLMKSNSKIGKAIIYFIISISGIVLLNLLPFCVNGPKLIVAVLATSFIMFLAQIRGEFIMIYQYAKVVECMENHRDVQLMKFGWIGSSMCMVFVYYLNVVGLDLLKNIYAFAYFLCIVFLVHRICRIIKYIKK